MARFEGPSFCMLAWTARSGADPERTSLLTDVNTIIMQPDHHCLSWKLPCRNVKPILSAAAVQPLVSDATYHRLVDSQLLERERRSGIRLFRPRDVEMLKKPQVL